MSLLGVPANMFFPIKSLVDIYLVSCLVFFLPHFFILDNGMVKHTQTIRRLMPVNCLSVFDHFGLIKTKESQTVRHSRTANLFKIQTCLLSAKIVL